MDRHKYTLSPAPGMRGSHEMLKVTYTKEFIDSLDPLRLGFIVFSGENLKDAGGYIDSPDAHPDDFDDKSILWNGAKVYDRSVVKDGAVVAGTGSEVNTGSSVTGGVRVLGGSKVTCGSELSGHVLLVSSRCTASVVSPPDGKQLTVKGSCFDSCTVKACGRILDSHFCCTQLRGIVGVLKSETERESIVENALLRDATLYTGCVVSGADVRAAVLRPRCNVKGTFRETPWKAEGRPVYELGLRLDCPCSVAADGVVRSIQDVVLVNNFWSSGRPVTYTRSNDTWVTGCFTGPTKALLESAAASDKADGGGRLPYVKALVDFVMATGGLPGSPVFEHTLITDTGDVVTDRDRIRIFQDTDKEG